MTSVPAEMPNHALPPAMNTATSPIMSTMSELVTAPVLTVRPHAPAVGGLDLLVRLLKEPLLVGFATGGLHGEDIGYRVGIALRRDGSARQMPRR